MKLKNEVTVGLVVLGSILLLLVAAFWLSGKPFGQSQVERVAIFREVGELKEGNPVKSRGVQVGRVTKIELSAEGEGVLVRMDIDPNLVFPPQPAVVLAPASLFGDWQASIISMPTQPDLEFTRATARGILPGSSLPDITQLTAVGARIADDLETLSARVQLAFTEETALDIRRTIENVQDMSETMTGFVEQQTQAYAGVSRNVLTATQSVTRVAGQLEASVPAMIANARSASENLEQLSIRLQSATAGVPQMLARADTTLANFGRLAATADQVMRTVQPQVAEVGPTLVAAREAMNTLQVTMTRLQSGDGTLGRLIDDPAMYEEMQASIATVRRLMADIQANPERYIGEFKVF
ncbi:MAG: MCE family protein [Gemmatimonadetes bacterium]|nr:MCE family protein [Gemmatimonadota bacterium]